MGLISSMKVLSEKGKDGGERVRANGWVEYRIVPITIMVLLNQHSHLLPVSLLRLIQPNKD